MIMTERDRMCLSKHRYDSADAARQVAGRVLPRHGTEVRVYRCPYSRCGETHWHVTTRKFEPGRYKGQGARSL